MTTTAKTTKIAEARQGAISHAGLSCAFEQIEFPGVYVSIETGRLFRIPREALASGRSPLIEMVGREPVLVTKISDDPYVPLSKARMLAADLDLTVNF
jgi:hypothetical protein